MPQSTWRTDITGIKDRASPLGIALTKYIGAYGPCLLLLSCLEPIVRSRTIRYCRWIMECVSSISVVSTLLTNFSNCKFGTYVLRESVLHLITVSNSADIRYGVQSFNISTIREWFLYHIALSGFVFSFLIVTIIVSRLFEMRVDKSSDEQDKYPLTSYALDRCSLQFGEVPVSNTHRTLSFLSGMLRLPSLLWTLATFCVYLFDSKLNDSLGVLVLRVACSVAGALVSPVILVKGLRKLGDADFEAEGVEIAEREMKKGVEGPKGF
ncbi:hypothetical protein QCA50_007548 [Cerrena zonata]|uniref:Uncharacterized protein n=1 Tax=Cerrena zonata TaxID=2478898 RepID=A0AAW0GB49_9APHY